MGKRRGGRGGDSGYEDQYGGGWSGGGRDHDSNIGGKSGGGGGGGGGGGTGGGSAGGGKPGSNVQYQRQLPKFLQAHAHLLNQEGFQEDAKNAWEDYAHSDQLAKYGDEDDVEGNARKGLGSGAVNHKALGLSNDAEEKEQLAKEEKGKGNRAFQEKRFEDAIKHFNVCVKLEPLNHVYFSNRSAAYANLKRYEEALKDGLAAVKLNGSWVKGYTRVGAANMGLNRFTDARESYEKALALDEDNEQIKSSLKEAKKAEESALAAGKFTFQSKRKGSDDAEISTAKKVKVKGNTNAKLLSFEEED